MTREWRVLSEFPVFPYGLGAARVRAQVWAPRAGQGTVIGAHDLIIPATTLDARYGLVTLNLREFKRVPGLTLAEVEGFRSG